MKSTIFWDVSRVVRWESIDVATCFHAGFLLGLFFDPEDGGDIFFQNVDWLSTDYMPLYPRRQYSLFSNNSPLGFPASRDITLKMSSLYIRMVFQPELMRVLTNSLTPWSQVLLEKPPVAQLLKNLPTFYGTKRFITVFTRALHWSLSWARSIQSIPPHPIWESIEFVIFQAEFVE
jgi:hypothetical protein